MESLNHKDLVRKTHICGNKEFIIITHIPTGLYVTSKNINERSKYKTIKIMECNLINKINARQNP